MTKKVNKIKMLESVADYIVSCDGKEYDDYVQYCDDENLKLNEITGKKQLQHVYAQALVGLGLSFPK